MKFIGKLTGNKRDVATGSPKALITHIQPNDNLDRDHCWVELTGTIKAIQPKGHQRPRLVEFEADLKEYLKQGTIKQYTLTNIRNIKRIKA